jgi:hypothetical protein
MKTALSSQQLVYFRRQGHVRFENYPLDFEIVRTFALKNDLTRDLWRKSPVFKKIILQELGPMALELARKSSLRLACDHYMAEKAAAPRLQDLFCFQGLACVFVFSPGETGTILDVFEPSSLTSLLPKESYLVAFALENGVLIENPKDPFNAATRNLGYVYGDRLANPHHPLIVKK